MLILWDVPYFLNWVAVHSGRTVWGMNYLARSDSGIVGSNPTEIMGVYKRLFRVCAVLCLGSGLGMGRSLVQGVPPSVKNNYRIE
jgi:hypothetical protein